MEHLLLLHGAIGAKDQLQPLAKELSEHYIVHSINFSGHGGTDFPNEPFSIQLFANEVLQYLLQNDITQTNIFVYTGVTTNMGTINF